MDIFDLYPQKFYLLSTNRRELFDFSSANHEFALVIEDLFNSIEIIQGGNIHALYYYKPKMLELVQTVTKKYKIKYPYVQKLSKYFKSLTEGDFFIRQKYNVPLLDLKRVILEVDARTRGLDVNITDRTFVQSWGFLSLSYDTFSYGFLTEKVFIGEPNKEKRVCRFCKKKDAQFFKHTSHALQESLGNHLLFAYEECDECNTLFSNGVETPLFRFLEINRNISRIKGKDTTSHHLEGLNFHIHPDKTTHLPIVYVKQEQIYNDLYKGKYTGRIYLYNNGPITYKGIYKALVKFAVDMIPNKMKNHFIRTGEWVHGDFDSISLPPFSYGEHNWFFEQPVLDLFFRNYKSPTYSPYCTAVLYIYDCIFIYSLPFNDIDENLNIKEKEIKQNLNHFKKYEYLTVNEWIDYDSNDTIERAALYKIPALGVEGKYRVEFRPSSDPIFTIKRNIVNPQ